MVPFEVTLSGRHVFTLEVTNTNRTTTKIELEVIECTKNDLKDKLKKFHVNAIKKQI